MGSQVLTVLNPCLLTSSESHLKCFAIQQTVAYTELKPETRAHIDMKLRRLSNFISNFVLTFVMQDIGFLLVRLIPDFMTTYPFRRANTCGTFICPTFRPST